jgi:hypothetical protein
MQTGRPAGWLSRPALLAAATLTAAGFAVGLAGVKAAMDGGSVALAYAALIAAGIADPVVARYLLLPQLASRPETPRSSLAILGYAMAITPATFAPVGALVTGSPWLALPFGGVAVYAWLVIWTYLTELPEVPPAVSRREE